MRQPIALTAVATAAWLLLGSFSGTAAAAHAAADPLADDLDALSLADKAPVTAATGPAPTWRIFIEGAAGRDSGRGALGRDDNTSRASLDLRFDARLAERLRGVLSDRLDLVAGGGRRDANTLREAFVSWAATDTEAIDLGRVNIRHGAALGYNPTDWFKENALRSIVSPDPAVLRENRQGTVVLQVQKLWRDAALSAAFSPRLGSSPNPATFALDWGATNPRNRWLLAGSYKLNDRLNPEFLLFGGADTPTQLGINVSALVGDATVAFAEFSSGRGRSLVARSLQLAESEMTRRRASVGATYTTPFDLGLTVAAEYNGAAPDRGQWHALSTTPAAAAAGAPLRVLGTANALQDLPVRRAVFVYASWKDAVWRRFDLSAFVRRDGVTHSRAQWLEARYRWDRVDLSLQWQQFSGAAGSVFGSVPQRRTVELVLRAYL